MAKINGLPDNLTLGQLRQEIQAGGKFVYYPYCISVLVMTFKRSSGIYYLRPGENAVLKGLGYILLSLIAGWWGLPWGIIYTLEALAVNLGGGKNVTDKVLASLGRS